MKNETGTSDFELCVRVEFEVYAPSMDDPGDVDIAENGIYISGIGETEVRFNEHTITKLPEPFRSIVTAMVEEACENRS